MSGNQALEDPGNKSGKSRYTVQAADKLLDILNVFLAQGGGQTVASISAATGIPRPTAFRLLSTLEGQEYLTRENGDYRLGQKCILLGTAAIGSLDLQEQARPVMRDLAGATKESVQLAVLSDWQVVYIEQVSSPQSVAFMTSRVGSIRPAYCTGLGKALLAYQPEAEVARWAAASAFERLTPTTLVTPASLLEDLALVRSRGFAIDNEERELGVACVAAPVTDHRGEVVAAVSVAAPRVRLPQDLPGSTFAKQVVDAAAAISLRLGCPAERWKAGVKS
ncbi:MAG: IclR family transcriptional regulator [Bifidobacteriaceae bacterium]|nr:IclR family transcriptional regulator [Bifidobacteriaceae bacterium]